MADKGVVKIRDFDVAIFNKMGATAERIISEESYRFFPVAGLPNCDGKVNIVFEAPDNELIEQFLPYVVMSRSIDAAQNRLHPGHLEYEVGSGTKIHDDPEIYDHWESREQAFPFDITYDFSINAARRSDANLILDYILKKFVLGYITVIDSDGNPRGYDVVEPAISQNDDVSDIHNRTMGFTVSLRVIGEINLKDAVTMKTVTALNTSLDRK